MQVELRRTLAVAAALLVGQGFELVHAQPPSQIVRIDAAGEVAASVYYMAAVVDALKRENSRALRTKDARIQELQRELAAGQAPLAAELAQLQQEVIAALSAKDAELARQVAAFRSAVEDIASTPEGVAILAQRRLGNLRQAREQLIDLETKMAAAEQKAVDVRSAGRLRSIATIAGDDRNKGEATTQEVIDFFEKVVALDAVHWDWVELGHLYLDGGNLSEAERCARQAIAAAVDDRERATALGVRGDVLVAQGNRADALKAYRDGLAITQSLATTDPGNAQWQWDLSVSFTRAFSLVMESEDSQGRFGERV